MQVLKKVLWSLFYQTYSNKIGNSRFNSKNGTGWFLEWNKHTCNGRRTIFLSWYILILFDWNFPTIPVFGSKRVYCEIYVKTSNQHKQNMSTCTKVISLCILLKILQKNNRMCISYIRPLSNITLTHKKTQIKSQRGATIIIRENKGFNFHQMIEGLANQKTKYCICLTPTPFSFLCASRSNILKWTGVV